MGKVKDTMTKIVLERPDLKEVMAAAVLAQNETERWRGVVPTPWTVYTFTKLGPIVF